MSAVNRMLGSVFDGLMAALDSFPPIVGLVLLSAPTAVALLLLVRVTSNQSRIAEVKRSIRAGLFEIRLFSDDPRAILRAQGEIVRHNLTYLRLSAVPLLWALVPLVLLTAQLQSFYGYQGLEPGRPSVLKVRLADGQLKGDRTNTDAATPSAPALTLETPEGVRVETPMVWAPSLNEGAWRLGLDRSGDHEVVVRLDGQPFTKRVHASDGVARRSPIRAEPGFLTELLHPAEPPLPAASGLRSIEVSYPTRDIRVLGLDVHWMVLFVLFTMVFAFALKQRFGVVL